MVDILEDSQRKELIELILGTFPKEAARARVEIYYVDGYAEFPSKYLSTEGDDIVVRFQGWDSPERAAKQKLVRCLSGITDLRVSAKGSENYWNHCLILVDKDGSHDVRFSYQPELDKQKDAEVRASIGDELYEKYKRERKERAPAAANRDPWVEAGNAGDTEPSTLQGLMSFLYREVVRDVPDDWERVEIDTKLGHVDGRNEIHTSYRYFLGDDTPHRFKTSNVFGPMNAVFEIQKLMAAENNGWSKAVFKLYRDGNIQVETDRRA
jgi:hypothetical protein